MVSSPRGVGRRGRRWLLGRRGRLGQGGRGGRRLDDRRGHRLRRRVVGHRPGIAHDQTSAAGHAHDAADFHVRSLVQQALGLAPDAQGPDVARDADTRPVAHQPSGPAHGAHPADGRLAGVHRDLDLLPREQLHAALSRLGLLAPARRRRGHADQSRDDDPLALLVTDAQSAGQHLDQQRGLQQLAARAARQHQFELARPADDLEQAEHRQAHDVSRRGQSFQHQLRRRMRSQEGSAREVQLRETAAALLDVRALGQFARRIEVVEHLFRTVRPRAHGDHVGVAPQQDPLLGGCVARRQAGGEQRHPRDQTARRHVRSSRGAMVSTKLVS
jgi:hypothetical protein